MHEPPRDDRAQEPPKRPAPPAAGSYEPARPLRPPTPEDFIEYGSKNDVLRRFRF